MFKRHPRYLDFAMKGESRDLQWFAIKSVTNSRKAFILFPKFYVSVLTVLVFTDVVCAIKLYAVKNFKDSYFDKGILL